MPYIREKINEKTLGGPVILWENRDETFLPGNINFNYVPVLYPCCQKIVLRHNSHFIYFRKNENVKCEPCRKSSQTQELHPNWKGGKYLHHGYVYLHIDTVKEKEIAGEMLCWGKYVPEHRLVVALSLGRPLLKSETIHHDNGIKSDNRIENLILLTTEDHASSHWEIKRQLAKALARIAELERQLNLN